MLGLSRKLAKDNEFGRSVLTMPPFPPFSIPLHNKCEIICTLTPSSALPNLDCGVGLPDGRHYPQATEAARHFAQNFAALERSSVRESSFA
jgi:hypothetical protein